MKPHTGFANFNITTIYTCIKYIIGKLLIVGPLAFRQDRRSVIHYFWFPPPQAVRYPPHDQLGFRLDYLSL